MVKSSCICVSRVTGPRTFHVSEQNTRSSPETMIKLIESVRKPRRNTFHTIGTNAGGSPEFCNGGPITLSCLVGTIKGLERSQDYNDQRIGTIKDWNDIRIGTITGLEQSQDWNNHRIRINQRLGTIKGLGQSTDWNNQRIGTTNGLERSKDWNDKRIGTIKGLERSEDWDRGLGQRIGTITGASETPSFVWCGYTAYTVAEPPAAILIPPLQPPHCVTADVTVTSWLKTPLTARLPPLPRIDMKRVTGTFVAGLCLHDFQIRPTETSKLPSFRPPGDWSTNFQAGQRPFKLANELSSPPRNFQRTFKLANELPSWPTNFQAGQRTFKLAKELSSWPTNFQAGKRTFKLAKELPMNI
ncbi:hypothetical protein J6590_061388 [Homalodisca vitripennis]|nr:hypothetical protein J6590_061388 [Homalodisca vitripennis]